jgi:hypothetical protein
MAVQAAPIIVWGGAAPQSVAVLTIPGTPQPIPTSFTVIAAPAVFQLAQLSAGHAL